MLSPLFGQEQTCPICSTKFTVQRVRSSAQRVSRRDTDFCIYYEGINPLVYSIWVCPECHFASTDQQFNTPFSDYQLDRLKKGLPLFKSTEPDFSKERSWEVVIRSFELAIRTAQIYHAKASYLGALFLRAAWACRYADLADVEKKYLSEATAHYVKAFEAESGSSKMSEPKLLYLIGELHRRSGNPKEAIMWFSRAVRHPGIKRESEVERLARDQWLLAKEEARESEDEAANVTQTATAPQQNTALNQTAGNVTDDSVQNSSKQSVVIRPVVSMMAHLYQDQFGWLQTHSNKAANKFHTSMEKETIIRAVLDAVIKHDIPDVYLENEEKLKNYFVSCFNPPK